VILTRIPEIRPYFKGGFLLIMSDGARTEIPMSERQAPLFRQKIPGLF
jgi:DNA-binding LytR/AlgR family response regulator